MRAFKIFLVTFTALVQITPIYAQSTGKPHQDCVCPTSTEAGIQIWFVNGKNDMELTKDGRVLYSTWGDLSPHAFYRNCENYQYTKRTIVIKGERQAQIYSVGSEQEDYKIRKYVYTIKSKDAKKFRSVKVKSDFAGASKKEGVDATMIIFEGAKPPPVGMEICWNSMNSKWGRTDTRSKWRNGVGDDCDQFRDSFSDSYHQTYNALEKKRPVPLPSNWLVCKVGPSLKRP